MQTFLKFVVLIAVLGIIYVIHQYATETKLTQAVQEEDAAAHKRMDYKISSMHNR